MKTKQCSKCKIWKNVDNFYLHKRSTDGLYSSCKDCERNHKVNFYNKNKDKIKSKSKSYRNENKDKIREYNKNYYKNNKKLFYINHSKWQENNIDKIREYNQRNYYKNKAKILKKNSEYISMSMTWKSKFRREIELYEEIKESPDGNVMCKCAYCGEWFGPTYNQIKSRLYSIYNGVGECRLYCSQNCKNNCPIYYQMLYAKDQKPANSREVQPELRKMVFARDNYTCQKCNTHRDNLEVGIHCHHKEGILWEPLQSADMDMCITLCEYCHKEVHGIPGCGYHDMQCK